MEREKIKVVEIERDDQENYTRVRVLFGPHYFIDIMPSELSGELTVYIGYTHHGFSARAVNLGDQLENIINEVREAHPELSFD